MSTCTWDGKRLSADTRCITGDVIDQSPCQKIFRKKGIYCAVAGDLADAIEVTRYLLNGGDAPDYTEGSFEIMLVSKDRCEYYGGNLKSVPLPTPFAIGSGGDYAVAAMLCGKTAPKAIKIAAKMDASTGTEFGIRTYKIRD